MKKDQIKQKIWDEVLGQTPQIQARAINALDKKYIIPTSDFLWDHGKKDFLKFLSISVLIVMVKNLFEAELFTDKKKTKPTRGNLFLKEIIKLDKFPKVWSGVQDINPTEMFQLIPGNLLQASLVLKLSDISIDNDYKKVSSFIYEHSRNQTLREAACLDRDDKAGFKSANTYSAFVNKLSNKSYEWVRELLVVLSDEKKLKYIYNSKLRAEDLHKIFSVIISFGGHISDDRYNPEPLCLGFLSYNSDMFSKSTAHTEKVESAVEEGISNFIKVFNKHVKEKGISTTTIDLLNFFLEVAYIGKRELVQSLPLSSIKKLFDSKNCLWMKNYLSQDQKINLKNDSSVGALDAHRVLSEELPKNVISDKTAKSILSLPIREKILLIGLSS